MAKKNKFLASFQEKIIFNRKFTMQQSLDMALIALNREFGFGADRLMRFSRRFQDVYDEYATLVIDDSKDDVMIEYSRAKLDAELQNCCGESFVDWNTRYDFSAGGKNDVGRTK